MCVCVCEIYIILNNYSYEYVSAYCPHLTSRFCWVSGFLTQKVSQKSGSSHNHHIRKMRRKLQQLINVGKTIALGKNDKDNDSDDDSYYETEEDDISSSEEIEIDEDEYVDPTRCWGRFYMTPEIDHADYVKLTCTISYGSTSMGGTYGCEGECDIVQRGPSWYIRFRQFELSRVLWFFHEQT